MNNNISKIIGCKLTTGSVSEEQFQLLIEISSLRSEKVINALRAYFVFGYTRSEACVLFNVNSGYLSRKVKEIQQLSQHIIATYPFLIQNQTDTPVETQYPEEF